MTHKTTSGAVPTTRPGPPAYQAPRLVALGSAVALVQGAYGNRRDYVRYRRGG
jgi:hypothetical protein